MRPLRAMRIRVSGRCSWERGAKKRRRPSAPRISPNTCARLSLSPGERVGVRAGFLRHLLPPSRRLPEARRERALNFRTGSTVLGRGLGTSTTGQPS